MRGAKPLQRSSFGIANVIREGSNFLLIIRVNILICSCACSKVAHWLRNLTHFLRRKQRKRSRLHWRTLENQWIKGAQVKKVSRNVTTDGHFGLRASLKRKMNNTLELKKTALTKSDPTAAQRKRNEVVENGPPYVTSCSYTPVGSIFWQLEYVQLYSLI